MSEPVHDLERLISRYLDDEATPTERRALDARLRHDPAAATLFEEHSALDREVKQALRDALRHTPTRRRPIPLWERVTRVGVLAAAACLALMFWFRSPDRPPTQHAAVALAGPSWFAPPPTVGDMLVEQPQRFDRPQIRVGRPDVDWIVIPSERPDEFLVVEVKRVLTRTIPIQRDF